MATIRASGNCNFSYIDSLGLHYNKPYEALMSILTTDQAPQWGDPPGKKYEKAFRKPSGGMFIFAQGSEDFKTKHYASQFAKQVTDAGLGKVVEIEPVPNPLHSGKMGQLYVWIIDHKACEAWWKKETTPKPVETPVEIVKAVQAVQAGIVPDPIPVPVPVKKIVRKRKVVVVPDPLIPVYNYDFNDRF